MAFVPKKLGELQLPTCSDVIQDILNEKLTTNKTKELIEIVSLKIDRPWQYTTIPVIEHTSVFRLLKRLHDEYIVLAKSKNHKIFENVRKRFVDKNKNQLFNICTCKCEDSEKCTCPRNRRIPANEREFINDQKSARKMVFARINQKT